MTHTGVRAGPLGAARRWRGHGTRARKPAWPVLAGAAALGAVASVAAAGPAAAQTGGAGAARPSAANLLTASWGANTGDQLGYPTKNPFSAVPGTVPVPSGMSVKRIRGGCYHAIALTTGGQVLTWGNDNQGELGDGKATGFNPTPKLVTFPTGEVGRITSVAASCFSSFALTSSGQVYAWGDNGDGELGGGQTGGLSDVPALVGLPAGIRATAISAGRSFALALTSGGHVYAWGANDSGQLGNNSKDPGSATPVPVSLPGNSRVTMIAAGASHGLARTRSGGLLAWGLDSFGQLGDGSTTSSPVPVPVLLPPGARVAGLTAGTNHSVALLRDGTLLAWGNNGEGELGDGSGQSSSRPVQVHLPAGARAKAVAAGTDHTIAVTSGGQLYGWGGNGNGQVGDGSTVNRLAPVPVTLDAPAARGHRPALHGTFAVTVGVGPVSRSSYAVYLGAS